MCRLMMSMTIVALVLGSPVRARAEPVGPLVLKISMRDYAHLPRSFVRAAQQQVALLYSAIGIDTVWSDEREPGAPAHKYDPDELVVNILPPAMSNRLGLAQDALGAAVVTLQDGGHIAYILFDRVSRIAERWEREPPKMLGLVVAHEVGHLLLPYGSHSHVGLMRPTWRLDDFNERDGVLEGFTPDQAGGIRARIARRRAEPSAGLRLTPVVVQAAGE